MATSWPTPQRGIVLGYPSRSAGARPYLIMTGDGGRTWRSLPAPPLAYPADNDQPDATFAGGVIVVQDGTHIVVTRDDGGRWSAERLARRRPFLRRRGCRHPRARIRASDERHGDGRVRAGHGRRAARGPRAFCQGFADVRRHHRDGRAAGRPRSRSRRRTVWHSRDGLHFVAAQLPCPVATSALLGGVRAGTVIALCSGSASDVGLGQNDKRVWVAARLGGAAAPSGPVFDSANGQGFAAASARDMTISTTFALYVTANGGRTWTAALIAPNGALLPRPVVPQRQHRRGGGQHRE